MKNQKTLIFCALLCVTLLCACFSTWDGSGGTIKVPIDKPDGDEKYTVILTSPGRSSIEIESAPPRDSTIVIDLPPGTWDIEIRVEDENGLTALGDERVEVKPGETSTVSVTMYPAAQANTWEDLFNEFTKPQKFNESQTDGKTDPINYIEITEDLVVDGTATLGGGNNGNRNITLRTNEKVTITRGDRLKGSLFQINGGSKLTLGGVGQGTITIEGNDTSGNESLITVSGELIMHDGVTLTGNTAKNSYNPNGINNGKGNGGGVYVDDGGIFIMKGGTISGNTSSPEDSITGNAGGGGGVYVHTGGTFIMKDGLITNNKTSGHGGGVRVYENGTFTMDGGTISDNEVTRTGADDNGGGVRVRGTFTMNGGTISGNKAPSGAGVGVADNGTTNPGYGTFIMKGGTISGNEATSSYGGGVRVFPNGTFTKTAGTIYGNNNNSLQNKATGNGQAVYAQSGNTTKVKNTTAGSGNNLSSSPNSIPEGDWD
jgi:hypothetical protein